MKKLINLTPHPITVLDVEGNVLRTIDKSELPLPRLVEERVEAGEVDGIPLINKKYSEITNLPAPQENVYYIVSGLVANAAHRPDLLVPNTVRNETGQIIGCDSFAQIL